MKLQINGDTVDTESTTVAELLEQFDFEENGKGMAVAVNNSVIPKAKWNDHKLNEKDQIEIIWATQGG